MTTIFIISIFGIIIGYDIWVLVTKRQTISAVFKKWYTSKPIVPYMVGVVFIGHFQTLVEVSDITLFIMLSCLYLCWYLIMDLTDIPWSRKFYNLNCKYFFIPMVSGAVIGSFWR